MMLQAKDGLAVQDFRCSILCLLLIERIQLSQATPQAPLAQRYDFFRHGFLPHTSHLDDSNHVVTDHAPLAAWKLYVQRTVRYPMPIRDAAGVESQ